MRSIDKLSPVLLALVITSASGCGGGYDEDEARVICDALVGNVDTAGSGAHQDCVECHMECGDECIVLESSPPQFNCP